MPTQEEVMDVLRECYDPEIPINIVDLGLVYGVEINGGFVKIEVTMTSRGCPMSDMLVSNIREQVSRLKGVNEVSVEIVWDPPWTPEKMSQPAKEQLGMV